MSQVAKLNSYENLLLQGILNFMMVMFMPDFTDWIDVSVPVWQAAKVIISILSACVEPAFNSVIVDSIKWVHRISGFSYPLIYRVMQKLHQLLHGFSPCISHLTPQQPTILFTTLSPDQTC